MWGVLAFAGLVGTLQGVAWLGTAPSGSAKGRRGAVLAPVGLAALALGVFGLLVPGFFGN